MTTRPASPPSAVEARQLTDNADWDAIAKWCGGELRNFTQPDDEQFTVLTLAAYGGRRSEAIEGDWVVSGGYGAFYVVQQHLAAAILRARGAA